MKPQDFHRFPQDFDFRRSRVTVLRIIHATPMNHREHRVHRGKTKREKTVPSEATQPPSLPSLSLCPL